MAGHGYGYMGPSRWSLWSDGSVLSIGSRNSVLSIGSVGSVLSVGSVGSAVSIFSVGAAVSVGSALSSRSKWSLISYRSTSAIGGVVNDRAPATAWLLAAVGGAVATDLLRRHRRQD